MFNWKELESEEKLLSIVVIVIATLCIAALGVLGMLTYTILQF